MIFNVKEITSILNNIAAFTAGDKTIPGVMIDNTGDTIKICYSDGRKAFIRDTKAIKEDTDPVGKFVVGFEPFIKAVGHCQPFGSITVSDAVMTFHEKVIDFTVETRLKVGKDEDGEDIFRTGSSKSMPLPYTLAGSDMRSAVLTRMNYDSIFDTDECDKWPIDELVSALNKLVVEQGRVAYLSAPWKAGFVNNQAYVTYLPIDFSVESDLEGEHPFDFNNNIQLPTSTAKAVATILSKFKNEIGCKTISVKSIDNKYATFFIDESDIDEGGVVAGLWVELAKGNKLHIENFRRYQAMNFDKYNITFRNDLFKDAVKTGMNFASADKLSLKFSRNEDDELVMLIKTSNANASTGNETYVVAESFETISSEDGKDITSDEIPVSLKILLDMVNSIDGELIAFDINVDEANNKVLRLAEIYPDKVAEENKLAREAIGLPEVTDEYLASGEAKPTPVDVKMGYRAKTLGLIQYALLQKA